MTTKEIQKDLKNKLKPARYEHTLGVSDTARHLAEIHGYDSVKAALAGLLHDCAKYMSDVKKSRCAGNMVSLSAMLSIKIHPFCTQNAEQFWQSMNTRSLILIFCMPFEYTQPVCRI